jgi:hypothetical protein
MDRLTPPTTWAEVPAYVAEVLARPLTKKAEGEGTDSGLPVVAPAAEVLGWRVGPLNAWRGGPRPLANLLVGSALGSLGGYGLGRLAEEILPERYFKPGGIHRRTALLGALAGAAPAAWQAYDNVRQTGDLGSVADTWPQEAKAAADELFAPTISTVRFVNQVMGDPNTPPPLQAATAGLVVAADAVGGNRGWVSPWDVGRVAVGAGAGLVSGAVAGRVLGLLAGLSPQAQTDVARAGLWAGALKQVVPMALGFK